METILKIPPLSQIQFFQELAKFLGNEKQVYLINGQVVEDMIDGSDNIINAFPFSISYLKDTSFYEITPKELWQRYEAIIEKQRTEMEAKNEAELKVFDPLLSGFVSEHKSRFLGLNPHIPKTTNYFPKTQRYQTHHFSPPNSYIIDIMFDRPYLYLIMINANTRYTRAEPLSNRAVDDEKMNEYSRNAKSYLGALTRMYQEIDKEIRLKGDSEKAFNSKLAHEFYHGRIRFDPIVAKDNHRQLAIIDRMVRTIRDMAHKIKPDTPIHPHLMTHILGQYNQVPHNGLSKILGFPCSPKIAEEDPEVERELIHRIRTLNRRIMSQPNYFLMPGTKVKIENPKSSLVKRRTVVRDGVYRVIEQKGVMVKVEGLGKVQGKAPFYVPRSMVAKA